MATRKRRSGSRTTTRRRVSSRSRYARKPARQPRRANKRVRRTSKRSAQVIRLEIVQPNPAVTNPIAAALAERQVPTTAKKARF